jgi:hypothetical protein
VTEIDLKLITEADTRNFLCPDELGIILGITKDGTLQVIYSPNFTDNISYKDGDILANIGVGIVAMVAKDAKVLYDLGHAYIEAQISREMDLKANTFNSSTLN